MAEPLHPHLAGNPLFRDLPAELLQQLEPGLALVRLLPGATLVRQGEAGDALFILLSGELEVRVHTADGGGVAVDRLLPGASVGEMALVAGQERTATVVASSHAELVRLSRSDFDRLVASSPELRDAVIRQMEPRLQRIQLSSVLKQWFPELDTAQVHELQETVSWVRLGAGEPLYRQGEPAGGMYLLVSGRLRLTVLGEGGTELPAGEVARGASIGEYAVLGEAPRSETVTAIRDSRLVRLDRDLVLKHPQIMAQIARNALDRAQASARPETRVGNGLRTLALVPAHPGAPVAEVAAILQRELAGAIAIDRAVVDERFAMDGAAETARGDALDPALTHWLNEMEERHEHVLLLLGSEPGEWTRRGLGLADQVLVVAAAASDPAPGPVELQLDSREPAARHLVLVHPDDSVRPVGTARWLDARPRLTHHHLRRGEAADAGRLARRLTGRAIGVVLSGGGARGYVHLGLLKALEELGIPVDMLAGTSMGAVVGGSYVLNQRFEPCYRAATTFGDPKMLLDKTLPLVALAESRNVTRTLQAIFGETRIEDLWTPFACVSANLTRAEPVIHERGLLWEAVRASSAIPGVFTPIVRDGEVLVDGGIMNNYPVDIMRSMVGNGSVIGSNAESASRNRSFEFGPSVSGWRVLLDRLTPGGRSRRYPSIIGTLLRATSVSSKHLGAGADALADVVIRYPARDFGNLEFDRYEELTAIGHEAAMAALPSWWESRGRQVAPR